MSFSVFALKGNQPTIITNKTTPSAQISAANPLYSFFQTNSGDIYDDVPQLTCSFQSFQLYTLKPKSMILTRPRSLIKMFSSFRSLWQIWQLWRTFTASAICLKFIFTRCSGIPPFIVLHLSSQQRLQPLTYSWTRTQSPLSVLKEANSFGKYSEFKRCMHSISYSIAFCLIVLSI